MTGFLLASILGLSHASAGCCSSSHVDDWRKALPPKVAAAIARVDQETAPPATLTPEEKRHKAELEADVKLGQQYAAEVEKELKLSANTEMVERVQRIGNSLATIANQAPSEVLWGDKRLNPFQYSFKVVEGKDVNAFSIPGGFIYVFEGLVKYAETDDELAGVLAHEIAHASLRHIAIRSKEQNKLDAVMLPLIIGLMLGRSENSMNLALGAQYLRQALSSGWNLKAEESADFSGFQYMLQSSYNPIGMLTFMERLRYDERLSPKIDWGIFATHPPTRERAEAFLTRLRGRDIVIRRSLTSTSLRADVRPGDEGTVELWYLGSKVFGFAGSAALSRADMAAEKFNLFMDSLPQLFEVRVDSLGNIVGRNQVLFAIAEPDWLALKTDEFSLQQDTVRAVKSSIYRLNQRVTTDGPSSAMPPPLLQPRVPPSKAR